MIDFIKKTMSVFHLLFNIGEKENLLFRLLFYRNSKLRRNREGWGERKKGRKGDRKYNDIS